MTRLSRVTLLFAIGFAATLMGPPLVGASRFPPSPDMHWQDVLDLATPLIMLPLYWLLVRQRGSAGPLAPRALLAFLVLGALWAEAQGMHLAANSIDNRIGGDLSTPAGSLIHFYDEVLSHYLWHVAAIGLMVMALVRQWRHPLMGERSNLVLEILAGLLYGFTFFAIVVEGGTGPLGVPAAAVLGGVAFVRTRGHFARQPVSTFVLAAHAFACLLFAAWWMRWGGLPGFYEVGLL